MFLASSPSNAILTSFLQLVAGDVSFVRVWDAERELSIQDIPTECPVGVTSIASHQGKVFATGCQDGSVRLFDVRVQSKYSLVSTYNDLKNWIVGVAMPKVRDNVCPHNRNCTY